MKPNDAIKALTIFLKKCRAEGNKTVSCDGLITFLNQVTVSTETKPSDAELAHYNAQLQLSYRRAGA